VNQILEEIADGRRPLQVIYFVEREHYAEAVAFLERYPELWLTGEIVIRDTEHCEPTIAEINARMLKL
jgi:hypothetical protein